MKKVGQYFFNNKARTKKVFKDLLGASGQKI